MKTHLLCALAILSIAPCLHAQDAPPPPPAPPTTNAAPALTSPQGKVPPPPGQVDIANEPTVKVVANVQPAVVNISTDRIVPQYVRYSDGFFQRYGMINKPTHTIGSGLFISADGYIVTNAHVVGLAEQDDAVDITLMTGSQYKARVVTRDDERDLALLKIDDKSVQFPYFDLTYVSPNLLGETVIALGSPEGYQNSVSQGIISAKGRTLTIENHSYTNLIQTDAAINPGNSGGPLVDLNGSLVGINSAKMSGQAIESMGFAIPHDIVIAWVNEAMSEAKGLKPGAPAAASAIQAMKDHLGLAVKTLTADKAASLNVQASGGLLITGVDKGGPAAKANLQEGMVIVSVGDRQVVNEKSLPRELLKLKSGDKVDLQVLVVQNYGPIRVQRGGMASLIAK